MQINSVADVLCQYKNFNFLQLVWQINRQIRNSEHAK